MARARGRPAAIDREAVITAALAIIDAEGTDAVTMRRLGADLGVSAMAPYRYFDGKEELLRAAAASVITDIRVGTVPSWQDLVQRFFQDFHDRLLKHPGVARLFGGQTFLSETVYAVSEPVFAALLAAGFAPETAVSLFMACATCSIGAALLEAEEAEQIRAGKNRAVLVVTAKYPAVAAVAAQLPSRQTPGAHAAALRKLIAGYALELDR